MIKQWYHKGLGIYYIYLPEKEGYILTSDGVMMKFDELSSLSMDKYIELKTTKNGFDYNKTRVQEKLTPKASRSITLTEKGEEIVNPKPNTKTKKSKKRGRPRKEEKKIVKTKTTKVKNKLDVLEFSKLKNINLFEWIYPKLMLLLAVVCSILSIYFTGVYLQRLQSKVIAFTISFAMLIYGLIGSQMSRRAFKLKRKLQGLLYTITSIGVIGFSMFSSLDVNYAKYMKTHREEVIESTFEDNKQSLYQRLIEDKNSYEEKIKIQMQQNTPDMGNVWNESLGKYVWTSLGTVSLTRDAKEKISFYETKISEIDEKLSQLELEGVSNKSVSKSDKVKSLTDLIGVMAHLSGNIVQMLVLLIPSIFIDLINILSITIYCDKYSDKK